MPKRAASERSRQDRTLDVSVGVYILLVVEQSSLESQSRMCAETPILTGIVEPSTDWGKLYLVNQICYSHLPPYRGTAQKQCYRAGGGTSTTTAVEQGSVLVSLRFRGLCNSPHLGRNYSVVGPLLCRVP